MHLCLLIIGLVLFPQAYTLNCFTCVNGSSCSETECPAEKNQCGVITMTTYNRNSKIADVTSKSCLASQDCFQASINTGVSKTIYTSECCTSNLCNTKNASDSPTTKLNGKKCYHCDEKGDCNRTVSCEGNEDQCIKVTTGGRTGTMKGCATKTVCLDINVNILGSGSHTVCCDGNFCNGVNGVSASILVLIAMLTSIFFLSK